MKKIILAAAALSFAALAYAPVSASAAPMRDTASVGAMHFHHHPHCKVVKSKVRHHGHWVVTTRKVCH
jgi:hypothetical protein